MKQNAHPRITASHAPVSRFELDRRRKLLLQWVREANAPHFSPQGEWVSLTTLGKGCSPEPPT